MIVLVMSSGVQNKTFGFDMLGFDFNRVLESILYRVLVGAWLKYAQSSDIVAENEIDDNDGVRGGT